MIRPHGLTALAGTPKVPTEDREVKTDSSRTGLVEKLRAEGLRAYFGKSQAIKGITLPVVEKRVAFPSKPCSRCSARTINR